MTSEKRTNCRCCNRNIKDLKEDCKGFCRPCYRYHYNIHLVKVQNNMKRIKMPHLELV